MISDCLLYFAPCWTVGDIAAIVCFLYFYFSLQYIIMYPNHCEFASVQIQKWAQRTLLFKYHMCRKPGGTLLCLLSIFGVFNVRRIVPPREYWTIYRGPGFLAVVWFGSTPNPSPSPVSNLHTGRLRKKERQLADMRGGEGMGEKPKNYDARKSGPL
jgi:hypothetical protein